MTLPLFYEIGARWNNFRVIKAVQIVELHAWMIELEHERTGAKVLHIANDDPENLFCLSFRTPAEKSNGITHILEHTVLCGSKKFPVKDPFFAMTRRSLNTYMNALTGQDFTCYPASSQNEKDFYNLLDVYIDAVFHPLLDIHSFYQEGHRLEFQEPTDPSTPLERKGIVYNEMKGALSSPSTRLVEEVNRLLFENGPYGTNSGGDPEVIPTLTHEELVSYHKKYYHPSHCLFFFYGNLPLQKHLEFLEQHAFINIEKASKISDFPLQKRYAHPRYHEFFYPVSQDSIRENMAEIAFSWLTAPIKNQLTVLGLCVLDIMLMDTDASILKKRLLASNLCTQAYSSYDTDLQETPFILFLKGVRAQDIHTLEEIITSVLNELVIKGFQKSDIESALHQVEFARCEISSDQYPFGLILYSRVASLIHNNVNAEDGLRIHSLFDELRLEIEKNPYYFQSLIRKYFLENQHFLKVVMKPSTTLLQEEALRERATLDKVRQSLTENDIQKIIHQAKALKEFQEKQENISFDILPKVDLADVTSDVRTLTLHSEKKGSLQIYHHHTFTNNIMYANLAFNIPKINEEDIWLLRLFTYLLPQLGSLHRPYHEMLEQVQAHTGGISAYLNLNIQAHSSDYVTPTLHIKGKSLYHKVDKLFPLMYELVSSINFHDIERIKTLIMKHATGLESTLTQNALKYAINMSSAHLRESTYIQNIWYGLPYYYKIQELAKNLDKVLPSLIEQLELLQKMLFTIEEPHLILSCESAEYVKLIEHDFYGLLNIATSKRPHWHTIQPKESEHFNHAKLLASSVSFISRTMQSTHYTHKATPLLALAAHIFDNTVLHTRIREQGGAYGSGAVNNSMGGTFYLYSYRDPNIMSTLNAFDEALKKVSQGDFDDDDLEEAKFEVIQTLDAPIAPSSKADVAYYWIREGKTKEIRHAFRTRILHATKEEIIDAVKNTLKPHYLASNTVIFTSKEIFEAENTQKLHPSGKLFTASSI